MKGPHYIIDVVGHASRRLLAFYGAYLLIPAEVKALAPFMGQDAAVLLA